jgi:hypothetical protein
MKVNIDSQGNQDKKPNAKATLQITTQTMRRLRSTARNDKEHFFVKEKTKRKCPGWSEKEEGLSFVDHKKRKLEHPEKTKKIEKTSD